MTLKLSKLHSGDFCQILSYEDDSIATKLISMGLFPQSEVYILNANNRKKVYFLIIGKLKIGLNDNEASSIIVKKLENK